MAAEQLKIASALLKDVMGKFHVCLDGQCDNEKQITIFFSRDKSAIGIVRRNQWQHTLWIAATQPEWIAINKVNAWITNDDKRACSSLSDEEQWLVLAIVQTFTHAQENIHAIDGTRVDEFTIEQTSAAKEDDSK